MNEKDVLTSVEPNGQIIISKRIQATLFCKMDLRKFPFDKQHCKTVLESWMYNRTEIVLHWEKNSPVVMGPNQHLTEYELVEYSSNETMVNADLHNFRHGEIIGNYSALTFTIVLRRQVGFYIMDYFIPSTMIVATSWMSFWLQADQTSPRMTAGCTTLLTFVTLSTSQEKSLPKVSYVKASEVWFLGCVLFIFMSIVEFAFVNMIWCRRKNVSMKKVNASNIFKGTLPTLPLDREKKRKSRGDSIQQEISVAEDQKVQAKVSTIEEIEEGKIRHRNSKTKIDEISAIQVSFN
jgi:hypothetical protein